jgi:hypothetical protein
MTMNKVFGFKSLHKPQKNLETPVAGVVLVVNSEGGGVGQEYVQITAPKQAVEKQPGDEFDDLPAHPGVGKLVFPPVIAHGAAEPGEYEGPFALDAGTYMGRPASGGIVPLERKSRIFNFLVIIMKILQIMVAENKEKGFIDTGNNEIKIIQGEIPGGEHEIHIAKAVFY